MFERNLLKVRGSLGCRDCSQGPGHCESGKELLLQGKAALQTQSFRDAEPQLDIPPKTKKNCKVPHVQLRQELDKFYQFTEKNKLVINKKKMFCDAVQSVQEL